MSDYYKFVNDLRTAVRAKAKPYNNKDLLPSGKPKPGVRRSYVNVNRKRGVETSGGFWFTVSGLNASTGERYKYRFDIVEAGGDLYFEKVEGPGVYYGVTSVLDNEEQLIIDIATEVGRIHEKWEPPKSDPREIMDEMQEEHEESSADVSAFSSEEQSQRDEARDKDNPKLGPDDSKPWWKRLRDWKRGR
jgi:hypothetical protein